MERYLCIHGHFYQPPRENPWLEAVEIQDSAYPYHDWNERITKECYAPNTASRILDGNGRIDRIINNYAKISFNFGPTLLAWLEAKHPDVYQGILAADRESQQRFSGHGSALAQAYNHMIMPLANLRDKYTQAYWGIRDFQHRFGRMPEGMWLPETAVDLGTLEVLAQLGITFTILSPYQAWRVRPIGSRSWREVAGGAVDPTMPYRLNLPSGRQIHIFFYDGPISRAVAFEGLLNDGKHFARRLMDGFSPNREGPQLVHIATDGESYGHHHRYGDMALAYALDYIETNNLARITNYGEYLELCPPTHEVEILESTSWSCAHGVERWRSDCGCNSGAGLSQAWRAPLREALDWLREQLAARYEERGRQLFIDPWTARDGYIDVVLDRSEQSRERFFRAHTQRSLGPAETSLALKLLEMQRHAMLMYTSCGWFFDELSGLETVQVIQYAGRAVQLAEDLFGRGLEEPFLDRLEKARSNLAEFRDGRQIYERFVKPAAVDLHKVGAHYAVRSLFEEYADEDRVYCYEAEKQDFRRLQVGRTQLAMGRVRVTSIITLESQDLAFGVLHFGDHNLSAGVRAFQGMQPFQSMMDGIAQSFSRYDLPEVLRLMDEYFEGVRYSLQTLFRDEQRQILNRILDSTLENAATVYGQIYQQNEPLMRFLTSVGMPLPRALGTAAEFVITHNLREALSAPTLDLNRVRQLLEEAGSWKLQLDGEGLAFALEQNIGAMVARWEANPDDEATLEQILGVVQMARRLPFRVDLWRLQNVYCQTWKTVYESARGAAERGSAEAREWVRLFGELGEHLRVRGGA